jgi:hypothetical protein
MHRSHRLYLLNSTQESSTRIFRPLQTVVAIERKCFEEYNGTFIPSKYSLIQIIS